MGSSSRGSDNSKMDKVIGYLEKISEIKSQVDDTISTVEEKVETAQKISNFAQKKFGDKEFPESEDNIDASSENVTEEDESKDRNKFIKYVGKIKSFQSKFDDVTSTIEESIEKAQKTSNFIYKKLGKSKKYSDLINKKLSVGAAKSVERMVNFTGSMMGKDFKKYAGAAKQLTQAGIKKTFLGTISSKQAKKLKKNIIVKKVLDKVNIKNLGKKYVKGKEGVNKLFTFTLDDAIQKGSSLIKKGTKKISNPKITKIMEKAADSKFIGAVKKAGSSKIVKNFTRAFSPVGMAMNLHTVMTEESDFKKVMAATDMVGDFTPIAPLTSAISLAGGAIYDAFDSKYMERFGGKKVTKLLDKGAGFVVKPVEKGIQAVTKFTKHGKDKLSSGYAKARDIVLNSIKTKVNAIKKNPIKETFKTSMAVASPLGYMGTSMVSKVIKAFKPKNTKSQALKRPSNVISLYNNKANSVKTNNFKTNYDRGLAGTKLLGNKNYSSKKNNFTININGSGLSIDQVANELAFKIQSTMANI